MMRLRSSMFVALVGTGLAILLAPRAEAQWVVFDPNNFSQNILTALRTLQSNVNDVQKIANQIQQLNHELQNLRSMPAAVSGPLLANYGTAWTQMGNTFTAINGLASNLGALAGNYNAVYPARGGAPLGGVQVLGQLQAYLTQAREVYRGVYQQSGQVMASLPQTQANLTAALAASSGASGNLDAMQAQTHLSAQVAQLLMQENAQNAAVHQAQATWLNQEMEAADSARTLAQQRGDSGSVAHGDRFGPPRADRGAGYRSVDASVNRGRCGCGRVENHGSNVRAFAAGPNLSS